jgi:hypothetical protein
MFGFAGIGKQIFFTIRFVIHCTAERVAPDLAII